MFFRRRTPRVSTFQERIEDLKKLGFKVQDESGGRYKLSRNGIAAIVTDVPSDRPHVARAGLTIGNEIGALVNGGYQQYWLTPSHKRAPALASQLKELHEFEEDLKEALGLPSLYNTSLGTISALHLYDRVEERDSPHPLRAWERKGATGPAGRNI